jgi:molybdopterin synthase catalytic subunit/molybdopterin converting factor small subunit
VGALKVTVRLFAMLRERAGSDSVEIELTDGATVQDAIAALGRDPVVGDLAAKLPLRIAVNREYAGDEAQIEPGDELAAIPPVSGGDGRVRRARVTAEPLDQAEVTSIVGDPGAGAVVTFQGTTRDVEKLSYDAYAEMAEPRIEAILEECVERHDLRAAAAEHRIGDVPLGEPSVVVAVSAAHRGEAFAGAREAIDRIKAEAPIWKKEVEGSEEVWVEGTVP